MQITLEGQELHHNPRPKYLEVTLDRTLSYKEHCNKAKLQVTSQNNILGKLTRKVLLGELSHMSCEHPPWHSAYQQLNMQPLFGEIHATPNK